MIVNPLSAGGKGSMFQFSMIVLFLFRPQDYLCSDMLVEHDVTYEDQVIEKSWQVVSCFFEKCLKGSHVDGIFCPKCFGSLGVCF